MLIFSVFQKYPQNQKFKLNLKKAHNWILNLKLHIINRYLTGKDPRVRLELCII